MCHLGLKSVRSWFWGSSPSGRSLLILGQGPTSISDTWYKAGLSNPLMMRHHHFKHCLWRIFSERFLKKHDYNNTRCILQISESWPRVTRLLHGPVKRPFSPSPLLPQTMPELSSYQIYCTRISNIHYKATWNILRMVAMPKGKSTVKKGRQTSCMFGLKCTTVLIDKVRW